MKKIILIFAACFLIGSMLIAQTVMQIQNPLSKFEIKGTSTVHDWEMNVSQATGKTEVLMTDKGFLKQIKSVSLKFPVESLKSDKKLMNTKTYEALKKDTYPFISFESSSITITSIVKDAINITVTGTLTLAGVSKRKTFTAQVKQLVDGRIKVNGNQSLAMTEFGVEPPKMFMGTLKTGDLVSINFDVYFK